MVYRGTRQGSALHRSPLHRIAWPEDTAYHEGVRDDRGQLSTTPRDTVPSQAPASEEVVSRLSADPHHGLPVPETALAVVFSELRRVRAGAVP